MSENTTSAKSIMINYGVILGVISILLSVLNYAFGSNMFQPHWSMQLFGFIALIAVIVYGMKRFKESTGGYLSLGQALKIGIGISAVSAVIGVIYFIVFVNVIEPDFFDLYMDFTREAAIEQNPTMTQEQLDTAMSMSEPFMNTGVFAGVQLVLGIFFGFIVSLIAGLVMKKENPYNQA